MIKPRVLLMWVKKRLNFLILVGFLTRLTFPTNTDRARRLFSAAWRMRDLTYAMIVPLTNVVWGTRLVPPIPLFLWS